MVILMHLLNKDFHFTLQMLHDATETVAMGSNQHPLSLLDLWNDLFIPKWQRPGDGVFKALAAGELVLSQISITTVLQPMSLCR